MYLLLWLKISAECTAQEAFSILGDNIIFASGSPFKNVDLGMYKYRYIICYTHLLYEMKNLIAPI